MDGRKFGTPVTRQRKESVQRSSRAFWQKISCLRFRYLVKSNCQFRAQFFFYLITFGLFYIWGKPVRLSYGKHVQQKRATANDPNQVVASCEDSDFWLDEIKVVVFAIYGIYKTSLYYGEGAGGGGGGRKI